MRLFVVIVWWCAASGPVVAAIDPAQAFNQALAAVHNQDYPAAVFDLRRSLLADPWSNLTRTTLERVRKEAQLRSPAGPIWWLWPLDTWALALAGVGFSLWAGRWAWLLVRQHRTRPRGGEVWTALLLVGALVVGASVWGQVKPRPGQIVAAIQGRTGDGEIYAEVDLQKWKPGQEVWLLTQRFGWSKIQVGAQMGWVPTDLVREIQ